MCSFSNTPESNGLIGSSTGSWVLLGPTDDLIIWFRWLKIETCLKVAGLEFDTGKFFLHAVISLAILPSILVGKVCCVRLNMRKLRRFCGTSTPMPSLNYVCWSQSPSFVNSTCVLGSKVDLWMMPHPSFEFSGWKLKNITFINCSANHYYQCKIIMYFTLFTYRICSIVHMEHILE